MGASFVVERERERERENTNDDVNMTEPNYVIQSKDHSRFRFEA